MTAKHCIVMLIWATAAGAAGADCLPSINATSPTNRFTVNSNGTATDNVTGLVWKRCSQGYTLNDGGTADLADDRCLPTNAYDFYWKDALLAAQTVNATGGFANATDWRVPNLKELSSIAELRCSAPAINLTIFPDTPPATKYWTSSPLYTLADTDAYQIDFKSGGHFLADRAIVLAHLRLVRGGF